MDIIVTISDEGFRVLESWLGVGEVQPWIQHALNNKLRQRIDASIIESTNVNPKKIDIDEKLNILNGIALPTKEERNPSPVSKQ